jgi:hypothetical protein
MGMRIVHIRDCRVHLAAKKHGLRCNTRRQGDSAKCPA